MAGSLSPEIQNLIKATCSQEAQRAVASAIATATSSVNATQAVIASYVANGTFHRDVWDVEVHPLRQNTTTFFLLIMAYFIYYMDVGFMLLEVGMVRTKNVTNALLKNVSYSFTQAVGFWVCGYAIAFGKSLSHFVGSTWWGWKYDPEMPDYGMWVFQYVFACTSGAIVTGAIAERAQIVGYLIYTVWASAFTYPFVVSWAWNSDGWLKLGGTYDINGQLVQVGFEDFAGSGVVHICGAASTLIYLIVLGPRIGRFKSNGESNDMPYHNLTLVTIGAMILYTGFLAFNSGSQTTIGEINDFLPVSRAAANTVLSGTGGFLAVMVVYRIVHKRWLLVPALCGGLAGCVGACCNCNIVEGWGAFCIGIFAGLFYMGISWLVKKAQIDDVVDAVAVHWGGGVAGCLGLAFFKIETGIFYAWSRRSGYMLAWQLCGMFVIPAWAIVNTYVMCIILKIFNLLRVDRDSELAGLDVSHGHEEAYPSNGYTDGMLPETLPPSGAHHHNHHHNHASAAAAAADHDLSSKLYPPPGLYHPWPGANKDASLLDLSSASIVCRSHRLRHGGSNGNLHIGGDSSAQLYRTRNNSSSIEMSHMTSVSSKIGSRTNSHDSAVPSEA